MKYHKTKSPLLQTILLYGFSNFHSKNGWYAINSINRKTFVHKNTIEAIQTSRNTCDPKNSKLKAQNNQCASLDIQTPIIDTAIAVLPKYPDLAYAGVLAAVNGSKSGRNPIHQIKY